MIAILALLAAPAMVDQEHWEPTKLPSWAFSASVREQSDEAKRLDYDRPISVADLSSTFASETSLRLGATLPDPPSHGLRVGSSRPTFIRETGGLARAVVTSLEPNGLGIIGIACLTTARTSDTVSQFRNWLNAYKSKYGLPKYVHVADGVKTEAEGMSSDEMDFSYYSTVEAAWVWDYPSGRSVVLKCRIEFQTVHVYVDNYVERGVMKKKTYRTAYPTVAFSFAYEYADEGVVTEHIGLSVNRCNPLKKTEQ